MLLWALTHFGTAARIPDLRLPASLLSPMPHFDLACATKVRVSPFLFPSKWLNFRFSLSLSASPSKRRKRKLA